MRPSHTPCRKRAAVLLAAGALLLAAYAPLAATEVGADDFRISDMGTLGLAQSYLADFPHVAYNPLDNEYLVVWAGDDDVDGNVDNEYEIFGQRIDATTGAELGANDFRISDMGGDNILYGASFPRVVFNVAQEEYLVVWEGDDNVGGLVNDELEIFGQRLSRTGTEIGADDFRISAMGGTGSTTQKARYPAVAWDATDDEYLVVWVGDRNATSYVEWEAFGQRLDGDGSPLGGELRISDVGIEGSDWYNVYSLDVAYNPAQGEYLVVFEAQDDQPGMEDLGLEILAQRIDADSGTEVGANDYRLSDVGTSAAYNATLPQVAWDPVSNQYLVVFRADDNVGGLVAHEYEIFGQRLTTLGAEVGADDFRISAMGGTGNQDIGARKPAVAALGGGSGGWLVTWEGYVVGQAFDVYGQSLDAQGGEVGTNDERLSDMTNGLREAYRPAVAYGGGAGQFLVVWSGEHDTLPDEEYEIFGQRTSGLMPLLVSGFEVGTLGEWSGATP
jgi:hypothetical protein